MIQLRILGTPALETSPGGEPSDLLAQPKRLALLAYLATAGGRALIGRDKVLALFWPEQPEERARHALNQALHVLRRAVGAEAIVARNERLGIDPTRLWCDAVAFREAAKHGDRATAVELYRGPLLDGLFLSDAPDFEQWLESTRTELHAQAAEAASRLADEAAARHQPDAVDLARAAAELLPHDEAAASRLIALLDQGGKSGAALAVYEAFARRLRSELELEPSAKMRGLVDQIRSRPARPSQTPVTSAPPPAPPTVAALLPSATPQRSRRIPMTILAIALGAVTLWSLIGRGRVLRAAAPVEAAALGPVAVLPFTVQGALPRGDSLGRELVELLSSRLDSAGSLRAVPPDSVVNLPTLASGAAVASMVEGKVTATGNTLHIRATWRLAGSQTLVAAANVEGPADQLSSVLDKLTIQLLAQSQTGPARALTRTAILTTWSLPALKAYLVGEQAFREGRFAGAAHAFERAAGFDSGFAMAQYRLGVTALWSEDYPLAAADAGARALRHSLGLSDLERRVIAGFDAWRSGNRDSAASRLLSVLASDRDNVEAWFQLGETLFHYNATVGLPLLAARDAFRQVVRIDPDHWGALWHLAMLDAYQGRAADLDRGLDHLLHLSPAGDYRLEIAALRACAHRDPAALSRLDNELRTAGEGRLFDIAWRCAVYGRDLDGARLIARLPIERDAVRFSEQMGRRLLATLDIAQGHWARARTQLDSLAVLDPANAFGLRETLALLPDADFNQIEPTPALDGLQVRSASGDKWRLLLEGRMQLMLGHPRDALELAARLDSLPDPSDHPGYSHALAKDLRAEAAIKRGDSAQALRELEGSPPSVWFGFLVSSPPESRSTARYLHAAALASQGRLQEALRWYGSLSELSTYDLVYAPAAHLRRGELFLQQGDSTSAAEEYARFLDLWKNADPELQPIVARARERLTQLSVHR